MDLVKANARLSSTPSLMTKFFIENHVTYAAGPCPEPI